MSTATIIQKNYDDVDDKQEQEQNEEGDEDDGDDQDNGEDRGGRERVGVEVGAGAGL